MRLIIVRHAETFGNLKEIVSRDSEKLSPLGRRQSKKLAERLAKDKIDVIYSSPILRCKKTIEPFLKLSKAPVIYHKGLKEREYGCFVGKPIAEYREWLDQNGFKDNIAVRPKGGESLLDVRKRVSRFINSIAKKHKGSNVLVVTHSGTKRALFLYILKREYKTHFRRYRPKNTALSIINMKDDGKHRARMICSVRHLEDLR